MTVDFFAAIYYTEAIASLCEGGGSVQAETEGENCFSPPVSLTLDSPLSEGVLSN